MNMEQNFSQVNIEAVSSYWDKRPCGIRYSPNPVGTKEYFDEVEKRRYFVGPHVLRFVEFEKWKGKKVLEVGCGIGTDTINFARHGAYVSAVELSEKSLAIAKTRAKIYNLEDKINFYLCNAEELSNCVPIEAYDLIYSFGVIHHTPHPEKILEQIANYTHPKTIIKIMLYNKLSFKVLWILFTYGQGKFWKLKELIPQYSEAQEGCPVTYTYTRSEIKKLLEKNSFRVTEMQVDHIFPYKISDYIKYKYNKVWYFRYMPKFLFRFLEKCIGWHICVTAKPV